jgi:ADP-ribose pyrophosphatase
MKQPSTSITRSGTDRAATRHEPWRILEERTVYDAGDWFRVALHKVRLPDGRIIGDYHQIYMPDYVTLLARTADGRFVMVRKYNHGYRKVNLLMPGGMRHAREPLGRAAARELLEETGYAARRWTRLGVFMPHSNYGCGRVHIMLGEECRCVAAPQPCDLERITVHILTEPELMAELRSGRNPSLSDRTALLLLQEQRVAGARRQTTGRKQSQRKRG